MFDPADKKEFAEIMNVTMSLYGRDATQALMKVYWAALVAYPMEQVRQAFSAWVQDPKQGTFMPKPADIIRTVQEASGVMPWLSANEAWALALPAADEAQSVVWTEEISKAWAVALPILDAGDKVGARMAFIPAYERLVKQAQAEGREAQWQVSQGWDPQLRKAAIEKAVFAGLLPPPKPEPVLQIAGPSGNPMSEEEREANRQRMAGKLRELGDALRAQRVQGQEERARQREEERQRFEARKAEVVAQALELDKQHNQKTED